jgi:hypothetical protein
MSAREVLFGCCATVTVADELPLERAESERAARLSGPRDARLCVPLRQRD